MKIVKNILNIFKRSASRAGIALVLFTSLFLLPQTGKATVENQPYGCYFTLDGNLYLNVWLTSAYLNAFGNSTPSYRIALYDNTNTIVGYFSGTHTSSNTYTFLIGPAGSLAAPYHYDLLETVSFNGQVTVNEHYYGTFYASNSCAVPTNLDPVTGCFYSNANTVKIDASFSILTAMAAYSEIPELTINTPSGVIGPIMPQMPMTGTTLYYVLPGNVTLSDADCYDAEIDLFDPSTNTQDWSYSWTGNVCACKDGAPCIASFTATIDPYNATYSALTFFSSFTGSVATETWTVSDGVSTIYNAPYGVSLLVPAGGTYTICHTVITKDGLRCRSCTMITDKGSGDGGDNGGDGSGNAHGRMAQAATAGSLWVTNDHSVISVHKNSTGNTSGSYVIYNTLGQVVTGNAQLSVQKGTNVWTSDLSAYPAGLYILKFYSGNKEVESRKIILGQ